MPFLDDLDSPEALQERQHPWTTIACSSSLLGAHRR
jgi:hypothetical protein